MNTAGCPYPLATDEFFQFPPVPRQCDTSLITFWVLAAFSLILRLIPAMKQAMHWKNRTIKRTQVSGVRRRRNVPIAQITSMVEWMFFVLLFLLGGFNVVNMKNGWSLSLLSAAFLFFACSFTVSYLRFVRLGNRILPKAHRTEENLRLSTLDGWGKVALYVQIGSLVLSSVILIIIGPIIPEHDVLLGKLGFAFKVNFEFFCVFGCIWQLERCKREILKVAQDVKHLKLQPPNYGQALWRMRKNQLIYCLFAAPLTIVFTLLICDIIPWTYYTVILLPFLCESFAFIVQEFGWGQGKRRLAQKLESPMDSAPKHIAGSGGGQAADNPLLNEEHDVKQNVNGGLMNSGPSASTIVVASNSQ